MTGKWLVLIGDGTTGTWSIAYQKADSPIAAAESMDCLQDLVDKETPAIRLLTSDYVTV